MQKEERKKERKKDRKKQGSKIDRKTLNKIKQIERQITFYNPN